MKLKKIILTLLITQLITISSAFASPYEKEIKALSDKYFIDPVLIKSVIRAESNFNKLAVSHKGAMGLMQLMPGTAKRLKVSDPFNAKQNIEGGIKYLRYLLKKYLSVDKALAAYNAGEGAVKKYKGIPPYKETINYLKKIKKYYTKKTGDILNIDVALINNISKEPNDQFQQIASFPKIEGFPKVDGFGELKISDHVEASVNNL